MIEVVIDEITGTETVVIETEIVIGEVIEGIDLIGIVIEMIRKIDLGKNIFHFKFDF